MKFSPNYNTFKIIYFILKAKIYFRKINYETTLNNWKTLFDINVMNLVDKF